MRKKKSQAENTIDNARTEETENLDGEMKLCKYCHKMVPKDAKVCPNCDKRLRRNWFRILLVFLIIAALAAVGGLYYYFYIYQPSVEPESAEEKETQEVMVNLFPEEDADAKKEQADGRQDSQDDTQDESVEKGQDSKSGNADGGDRNSQKNQSDKENADAGKEQEKDSGDKAEEKQNEKNNRNDRQNVDTEEKPEKEAGDTASVEITAAIVTAEDICGADGPLLDYADSSRIIFHDYLGLFVYDLEEKQITAAIDLAPIGCQYTQGDAACEVLVEEFGEVVYLHPADDENMYVYHVEEQTLIRQAYALEDADEFVKLEQTDKCIQRDPTVFQSFSCAKIKKDTYLYLESGSGMEMDLCYVTEKKGKRLEYERLFDAYLEGAQGMDGSGTETAGIEIPTVDENGRAESAVAGKDGAVQMQGMDATGEPADMDESEEAFRADCELVFYKTLLRQRENYLQKPVKAEMEVVKQIDGGLFDESIYYLCVAEDKDGIRRYYIIRDDRDNPFELILEGDVLMVYGNFFGTGRLPADISATRAAAPAIAMRYFDLLEE